jgi:elongation factor G
MSALAFKTVAESNGDLVYIRVYSGEMKPGETYTNTSNGKKERIARFYRMMGDKRIALEKAGPGDIVAAMGLSETYTGNTLSDPDEPIALEAIQFPKPVVSQALAFSKTLDSGKVGEALNRLVRDDPTLKTHTDEETKDTIISGMGELHLEISIEKLKRAVGVPQEDTKLITLGKPRVAYRQCLARSVDFEYKFQKQTGGRGIDRRSGSPPGGFGSGGERWVCRDIGELLWLRLRQCRSDCECPLIGQWRGEG